MLNPLPYILEITAKNNETYQNPKKGISISPFIALFVNYSAWNIYGLIIRNPIIFLQNLAGVFVSSFYLYRLFFSHVATSSQKRKIKWCILLVFMALLAIGAFYRLEWLTREVLGWLSDLCSLAVFASPLAELTTMIRNRSTESMSFSFALCCWVSALSWSVYGILVGDVNILVPNALGFFLACVQIALFAIYPNKKKKTTFLFL